MKLRHLALACLIPLPWLIACDRKQPVGPALEAGATGAGGPTVKAPSNTNASAASDTRIDIAWQDNSTNETGFDVWRSSNGPGGTFTKLAGTGANVTKYSDGGLSPVTPYCYRVRAFRNYDGKTSYSDYSNAACVTTPAPPVPTAPSATNAVPSNSTTIDVTWTDNSAAEVGFRVERSLNGGTSWATLATTVSNVTSVQDAGRASEQQVCYRVIAFNAQEDSPPSNTDCTAPPAPPSNLTGAGVSGPAIELSWTDNSALEDGFEVERTGSGVIAILPANTTSYRDAGVSPDVTYEFFVRATKDGGASGNSNFVQVVVVTVSPAAPSGADAFPYSSTEAGVTWIDNATNETGFRVERSTDGGARWVAAGAVGVNVTSFFYDSGQPNEPQQLCYRVIAFNALGESLPSNADCTTLPMGPTDLIVTNVDLTTIDLAWTDNSAIEDGYEVWECWNYVDGSCIPLVTLPANTTSWRHYESWYYRSYYIVAKKDGGQSDRSNEVDRYVP